MKTNGRKEILDILKDSGKKILCAYIELSGDLADKSVEPRKDICLTLPVGYNDEAYEAFLSKMAVDYDNTGAYLNISGTIWFTDGTDMIRVLRERYEEWDYRPEVPIPAELGVFPKETKPGPSMRFRKPTMKTFPDDCEEHF